MSRRRMRVAFGPGAASLILIVVILSMSVLGMLALMNARSDIRLSERAAQVVEAGYLLNAEAERSLAALDAVAARCAAEAESDGEYADAVRARLPGNMEMNGREISWSHTDGRRTLECAVALAPLGEGTRLQWTSHRLTAITEDAWN